jgi:hypothetical protein
MKIRIAKVQDGFEDEPPADPPIETEIGQVYYVLWMDGSENLFIKMHEYSFKTIAGNANKSDLPAIDPAEGLTMNPNWRLVKKIKQVPRKNLPLYVSWIVNRYFTRLLQEWKS